jgi:hypothetical protein
MSSDEMSYLLLSSCKLSTSACFWPNVMPIFVFFMGLLCKGVLTGLLVFVGMSCGGAGKFCIETELVDSVDFGFVCRVGAIVSLGVKLTEQ